MKILFIMVAITVFAAFAYAMCWLASKIPAKQPFPSGLCVGRIRIYDS